MSTPTPPTLTPPTPTPLTPTPLTPTPPTSPAASAATHLRDRKHRLAETIEAALSDFTRETGVSVESLSLDTLSCVAPDSGSPHPHYLVFVGLRL